MTIEEFKSYLENPDVEISSADFEKIHTVYQYHPIAKTRLDVARFYDIGGMILINDMLPRAKAIGQAEREMLAAKRQYEELNEKYMELKRA